MFTSRLFQNLADMVDQSLLQLARRFNNFYLAEGRSSSTCLPFVCDNHQVGLVAPSVLQALEKHCELFRIEKKLVTFVDSLDSYEKRSSALDTFFRALRQQLMKPHVLESGEDALLPRSFCSLAGWRDENYGVGSSRGAAPLFEVERAATPILGLRHYGVHINGMVQDRSKTSLWLQVRSKTKPTFPGKLGR